MTIIGRILVNRLMPVAAVLLCVTVSLSAADQIAVVTSTAQFRLRGAKVATDQGVPSWPVMAGDIVQVGNAPAAVAFSDGSSVILDRGTLARVERSGQTPMLQLLCGTVRYSLKTLKAVKLMAENGPVTPSQLKGSFSRCKGHAEAGWWTGGHTAMVVGAMAEAAAAWFGIAAAINGGKCVSPTNCGDCVACNSCASATN
jgi:hypothetical protein